jgi:hypothetical protein
MRKAPGCPAEFDESGYKCVSCGACSIKDIVDEASKHDFKTYIVPGGSLVKKIFADEKITGNDVIIGIACDTELNDMRKNFSKNKFNKNNVVSITLNKDGCINTGVDTCKVIESLGKF